MFSIQVRTGGQPPQVNVNVEKHPNTCPMCHVSIIPAFQGVSFMKGNNLDLVYHCPNESCQIMFVAKYDRKDNNPNTSFDLKSCAPAQLKTTTMSETISGVSPDFCKIYGQAEQAEHYGLDLVAGPGYRKALEFLIKDYACTQKPDKKDAIEKMLLGNVIATYISGPQIREIAKRAAWLGNDETHYVRKWTDKDLKDLKKLIALTLHWIEAEKLSQDIIKDMPEAGPAEVPAKVAGTGS